MSEKQAEMYLKLWGVRGSIPCPGHFTRKYGGNTPCLELRIGEERRLIIIDAGSGIRELGNYLMTYDLPEGPLDIDLFLTHTHWDHIMGFPFFAPIYHPETKLRIFGPVSFESEPLEEVIGGQMAHRYFPVNLRELKSTIEYNRLQEISEIDLGGGLILRTKLLNHPLMTLGYRFEYKGKVFCTCYDTEPYHNFFAADPDDPDYDEIMVREGEEVAEEMSSLLENFFRGADLLIHDAQYTDEEYEQLRRGWGHSPMGAAIASAKRANVKKLALFHHDPERTDSELDVLEKQLCGKKGNDLEVFFAREGMEFFL